MRGVGLALCLMFGLLYIDVVIKKTEKKGRKQFVAFFGQNPDPQEKSYKKGFGQTKAEALGKLVMLNGESFDDVVVRFK